MLLGTVVHSAAVQPNHVLLLLRVRQVLRPDVEVLAVLVLDPVSVRKDQLVGADRRDVRERAARAPDLSVLDPVPGGRRLGQPEALGLRVANTEEGQRLALPEPAQLAALDLDHRWIHVGTGRRRRRGRRSGLGLLLAERAAGDTGYRPAEQRRGGAKHLATIHGIHRDSLERASYAGPDHLR